MPREPEDAPDEMALAPLGPAPFRAITASFVLSLLGASLLLGAALFVLSAPLFSTAAYLAYLPATSRVKNRTRGVARSALGVALAGLVAYAAWYYALVLRYPRSAPGLIVIVGLCVLAPLVVSTLSRRR